MDFFVTHLSCSSSLCPFKDVLAALSFGRGIARSKVTSQKVHVRLPRDCRFLSSVHRRNNFAAAERMAMKSNDICTERGRASRAFSSFPRKGYGMHSPVKLVLHGSLFNCLNVVQSFSLGPVFVCFFVAAFKEPSAP